MLLTRAFAALPLLLLFVYERIARKQSNVISTCSARIQYRVEVRPVTVTTPSQSRSRVPGKRNRLLTGSSSHDHRKILERLPDNVHIIFARANTFRHFGNLFPETMYFVLGGQN